MSDTPQNNDKFRLPDYEISQEIKSQNGRTRLMPIGGVWEGKNGYLTGETVHGRLVLQPRNAKEALEQMRQDKQAQGQSHEPSQGQRPEQSPGIKH